MTVNTTKITAGPYEGNDIADTFSYGFRVVDKSQLVVFESSDLNVVTELTVDTDFTVAGVGVDSGGTITRVAGALPSGFTWYIKADYKKTQLAAFQSQGAFFPDLHEDAMDQLTFLAQQICDSGDRSPRLRDSYAGTLPLSLADPSAGLAVRWNGDGDGLENYDPSTVSNEEIAADKPVVNYSTLNAAITDTSLKLNQACNVKERVSGSGGGAMWDVVLVSTVTPNTYDVVQCTGVLSLALKLRIEGAVAKPAVLGASGDGITDDIDVLTYMINAGYTVDTTGRTYLFDGSLAVDTSVLSILGTGKLQPANRSSAITLSDAVTELYLRDFTLGEGAGLQTINDLTSSIDVAIVDRVTVEYSELGIHLLGAVKNGRFTRNRFKSLHRTLLDQSCQGIKIGNNQRATALETQKIIISDNIFDGIVNDFNRETHAFIVYGREVTATGNIASGVTHVAAEACETYYFKADIVTCNGNTVLNQGVSNDGCINFKGGPEGDAGQVTGQHITCIGNTIVNEDASIKVIGISCTDEHALISNNTLRNCGLRAFSGDDMLFSDNLIYIDQSSGSVLWFEVENASNVALVNNKVIVIANNFDVNTAQAGRVRASAEAVTGFRFIENEMNISYPDLTTGANSVAAIQLWAENFDITGADIRDNKLLISAPSIGSSNDLQFVSFSGANLIDADVMANRTNVEKLYFDDNSWVNRDIEFDRNKVNGFDLTTGNKAWEDKLTDIVVTNTGATGIRTDILPAARKGITHRVRATSSFAVTVATADQFTDGTMSKSLSAGASVDLRCYQDGVWHIDAQAGTIT